MRLPPGHVAGQGVLKPSGYGGFGERMLKNMGWEKGQGLGLNADGIKEAIQVKKKEDTVGVGGNGSWKWEEKYWETAYESVQLTNKGSDSSDDESSDDDSEAGFGGGTINRDGTLSSASVHELRLLKALSKGPSTGRFGGREAKMARIREQEAKLAAEYAARLGVSVATTTATTVTTTAAAAAAAAAGASDRSETTSEVQLPGSSTAGTAAAAATTGAPSESKGKKAKKEGKRKEEKEAAAAAGDAGADSGSSRKKRRKEGKKASKAAAEDAAASQGSGEQQAQQQQAQQTPRQRVVIEPAIESSAPMAEFKPTPAEGWWGAKRFVSAGCLECAKKDVQGAKERMVFTEGDQERVYMAAHAGKVAKGTKKGLGQSQAVGKVGGVKWAGSKVTFQDDDDGNAGGGGEERERCPKLAAVGSSTHLDSLAAAEVAVSPGSAAAGASTGPGEGRGGEEQPSGPAAASPPAAAVSGGDAGWQTGVKWRKLVTQALQAAPGGTLKLKELQKQVAAAVLEKLGAAGAGAAVGKKEVRAEVAARVQGSGRFVVEGKVVRLKG